MTKSNPTVSTSQVVAAVANRFPELPKRITKEVISNFLSTIESEVVGGNKVRIDRIGIILSKERAARKGRNPQTGDVIDIPASKKISFRASKSLKEKTLGSTGKKKAKK